MGGKGPKMEDFTILVDCSKLCLYTIIPTALAKKTIQSNTLKNTK